VKVLVVGQGAREHALAWKLSHSPRVDRVFAAPGNAGMARVASCIPISAADCPGLADFAVRESVDLTVVGPEAPLVAGLADELADRGLRVFGPSRPAARVEGSKSWARELCERHGIPQPRSRSFTSVEPAVEFLDSLEPPYVVKADGLAGGKGVAIAKSREDAVRALEACLLERAFGDAGTRVLVEEFVSGREVSVIAVTDGHDVAPLALAQDYKRAGDEDTGPNTGGMGAYSPVSWVDEATRVSVVRDVVERVVRALADEGTPYRGALYAGMMMTADGPKLLEFNCRLGDPETEAILPRLSSDLAELLMACVDGDLASHGPEWVPDACVTVVLASGGYPGAHRTGLQIDGLGAAGSLPGVFPFHAGTAARDGRVLTAGGRVLAISALGPTMAAARERAYEACSMVSFQDMQYRTDIAAGVGEEA
jgi:phosphoribosylamine---glycine ligase